MKIELREDKFHVRAFFAPCACRCRFCCLGDYSKKNQITFDDYERVMKKVASVATDYGMRLRSFIYNCPEHPYLKRQIELYDSLPMEHSEYTQLDLNGTKIKTEKEISDWFDELQSAGIEKVAFSWFGNKKTHDTFVQKKGYFDYLNQCAVEAKRREMPVVSKVFLHKGILDEVDGLVNLLSQFSTSVICAFMEYSGHAKKMQNEFITIEEYESLSSNVKQYMGQAYLDKFKTETEWIDLAVSNQFPKFNIVDYILYLNSENLQQVLKRSNQEIIEYFRALNLSFQQSFGEIKDLAEKYGDKDCIILYECRDVLRKWLDIHYQIKGLDSSHLFGFTHNCVEWKVYERL